MKIRIILKLILALTGLQLHAQWTWVNGTNQPNAPQVVGTPGVASLTNTPRGNYAPSRWNDKQGNIWIYSNSAAVPNNTGGALDDYLWKYDTNTNMWTLMRGSGPVSGPTYGVMGVPSPLNDPGGTIFQGTTWVDLNGDLWLYGGGGNTALYNDCMWRYSVATNEWTWMSGSTLKGSSMSLTPPNYGIKNVPSPTNSPGLIFEVNVCWTDAAGDFWMINGNASWRYSVSSRLWTWMGGSSTGGSGAVYGTKGVAAAANHPDIGETYGSWLDASGNCYFFGGGTSINNNAGFVDAFWKYDPITNQFTWMGGSTAITPAGTSKPGNYGTQCISSPTNYPTCRFENRFSVTDRCGNFWMFGGATATVSGLINDGALNDLWKYNPKTNEWTWVSGSNQPKSPGNYGTKGIASPNNMPPSRLGGIAGFNKGIFIGFGGNYTLTNGSGHLNDIWKYAPKPTVDFTYAQITNSCSFQFNDKSISECGGDLQSWYWDFGDGTTSNLQNPQHQFKGTGTYTVELIVKNCLDVADTIKKTVNANIFGGLIVNNSITDANCTTGKGEVIISAIGVAPFDFDWNPPVSVSNSATNLTPGTYFVVIKDASGCRVKDTITISMSNTVFLSSIPNVFTPNGDGRNDMFNIGFYKTYDFNIEIYDRWGILVFKSNDINKSWDGKDGSGKDCSDGTFFYRLVFKNACDKKEQYTGFINLFR